MKHGVKTVLRAVRNAPVQGIPGTGYDPAFALLLPSSVERFHMKARSLFVAAAMLLSTGAMAHEYRVGDIYIGHPYARASVPGQTSGGAYLSLENKSAVNDVLVSVETPAAASVEIHTMSLENNVMRMREVAGIDLQPGAKITMTPGNGYHLMLLGLKTPLKAGDRVPLTLRFKKAGKVETMILVEDGNAAAPVPSIPMHQNH
jgi:copper(I)-binding protein